MLLCLTTATTNHKLLGPSYVRYYAFSLKITMFPTSWTAGVGHLTPVGLECIRLVTGHRSFVLCH